ncbi:MAG TPA: alpha-amylase family glycosyl hydrolase [Solirubrobacteraceae bacterium]|nr:alpha-amylase family glycosyl hydrolase [Solirubrobacteraceae bacterium]
MIATYRLQLSPEQDFDAVRALVPYLRDLGISHLYLSPSLQARTGSTHGYDVVDPTRVSDALGGEAGLRALAGEGLQIVLDIVPNHMGVSDENRWWVDEEQRARVFDYDPADGWYRRFFAVDDLAAVRVEDPEVFELVHAKVLELVRDGVVDGLRVDHPDGLADPAGYLARLRDAGAARVWVEKILSRSHPSTPQPPEALRDWPVEGTVGYEFLNDAAALFVDPAGEAALARLPGAGEPFEAVAARAQLEQARTTFGREVKRLRKLLDIDGIPEALAALPIYRTYVEPWSGRVEEADLRAIAVAAEGRLADVLALRERGHDEFVTRFQQTSPPVTAKGIEDTAFYRHLRLLALNEVGGDPARFGLSVDAFHAASADRAERFPGGLLVTQTHDTKRSGDMRARIGALSTMAAEWAALAETWVAEADAPDEHCAYLVLQTLVGCWPIEPERLEAYVEKALREARLRTSWAKPDEAYEAAARRYARGLVERPPAGFVTWVGRVAAEGRRAALGQLLLKLTSPGVPDVYQGDELEALSLVDPDNRRPVDWETRRAALARLQGAEEPRDFGERKLDLIRRALALRVRRPAAFAGAYEPVDAGPGVCAYLRGGEVLVVVPVRDWQDARLVVPGRWRSVLDARDAIELGEGASVAELTGAWAVALLERA